MRRARCIRHAARSCVSARDNGRVRCAIVSAGRRSLPANDLTDVATGSYHHAMRAVGIKALKNKLSEYVRVAADGETVLVTDRDRVVAELGPPQPGRAAEVSDALLADVVRRGWLRPPIAPSEVLPARKPVAPLADLLHELDGDRSDR